MIKNLCTLALAYAVLFGCISAGHAQTSAEAPSDLSATDSLAPWRQGVQVRPVTPAPHHSIHSYFNTCPESPDGRWVLFYASTAENGHDGEIRIRERTTGKEKVLSRGVAVEDAHRTACQQWVSNGKRVVFHNVLKNGEWVVMCVDIDSGKERVLARNRQVGFGQPHADLVPLYGLHWNPGPHRDIELVDVATGTIRKTAATAAEVVQKNAAWAKKQIGAGPYSIYIPMLSPDLTRVFFKLAQPAGGDYRSRKASKREGLICYDLKAGRLLPLTPRWGHPAWHPDSRHIFNVPGVLIDCETASRKAIPNYPKLRGSHPSLSPDSKLFTSDTLADMPGGAKGEWAVGIGSVAAGGFVVLHTFDNSRGARSWRVSHPHPVFNATGTRIYFNVNADEWTRLYVAERQ